MKIEARVPILPWKLRFSRQWLASQVVHRRTVRSSRLTKFRGWCGAKRVLSTTVSASTVLWVKFPEMRNRPDFRDRACAATERPEAFLVLVTRGWPRTFSSEMHVHGSSAA